MELSDLPDGERTLIMSGIEAKWRQHQKWGWYEFDFESAYNVWVRIGVSVSEEFHEAMKGAGYGTD